MARKITARQAAAEFVAEAQRILDRVTAQGDASGIDTWTREVAIRNKIIANA